jgi:hypothetical protein
MGGPDGGNDDGLFRVDAESSRVRIRGGSFPSLSPLAVFLTHLPVPNVHGEILGSPIAYSIAFFFFNVMRDKNNTITFAVCSPVNIMEMMTHRLFLDAIPKFPRSRRYLIALV